MRRCKGLNAFQCIGQLEGSHLRVVRSLGPEPVAGTQAKKSAEPQIGVGRHGALAGDDFADARSRNVDRLGQSVLADAQGLQELLIQQFPGCDGRESIHGERSVIVNDFNVFRAIIPPAEAQSELVVDAVAVLASAITPQDLEAIARWHP